MCGIFGISTKGDSEFATDLLITTLKDLFTLSESRGKEATGLAVISPASIQVYKQAIPASKMIRSSDCQDFFRGAMTTLNCQVKDNDKKNGADESK